MESIEKSAKIGREPQTVTTLSNDEDSNSDDSIDSDVMDKQYMEREMQMR
jgi:hypothetical protein